MFSNGGFCSVNFKPLTLLAGLVFKSVMISSTIDPYRHEPLTVASIEGHKMSVKQNSCMDVIVDSI